MNAKSARAVTFIAVALACAPISASTARAGDAGGAPNVAVERADGTPMHLADLRGRVVLVDFWASWCTPCKTSFPALDALYRELQPRGFEVLAINLDERRADADAFLAARPHVMPVAFDPGGAAPLAFKVRGMPTSVLIDRAGNIRYTHTGYSAKVVDEYRQEIGLLLEEGQP